MVFVVKTKSISNASSFSTKKKRQEKQFRVSKRFPSYCIAFRAVSSSAHLTLLLHTNTPKKKSKVKNQLHQDAMHQPQHIVKAELRAINAVSHDGSVEYPGKNTNALASIRHGQKLNFRISSKVLVNQAQLSTCTAGGARRRPYQ